MYYTEAPESSSVEGVRFLGLLPEEKTKVPQGGLEPPTRGFIGRGGLLSAIGQSWAIVVEA